MKNGGFLALFKLQFFTYPRLSFLPFILIGKVVRVENVTVPRIDGAPQKMHLRRRGSFTTSGTLSEYESTSNDWSTCIDLYGRLHSVVAGLV